MIQKLGGTAIALGSTALLLGACGSNQSDISQAVSKANSLFADKGITLDCPKTVNTNSRFDCTLSSSQTGKTATVKFHIVNDKLDAVSQSDLESAVAQIATSGNTGTGTETTTTGNTGTGTGTTGGSTGSGNSGTTTT